MNVDELLKLYDEGHSSLSLIFKAVVADKQIVMGEVYVPNVVDTHNEMMMPDDVELMAHRFMAGLKNDQIDIMHNNRAVKAVVVESFIARKDDPTYHEGAWVLGVKIADKELWDEIKTGKYNGFSVETWVTKKDAVVELSFLPQVFGFTQKADGHEHAFFIQMSDEGDVVSGNTSSSGGHEHTIGAATATEHTNDHAHRIDLP